MPVHICTACGTSFPDAPAPPESCPVCTDERQYVPESGQAWTVPETLARTHANGWRQLEPDLFELQTHPAFAIGQRALLVRTPAGNVLWDCIALLDEATVALVRALGGLAAIAISHPHYYTTMQDWAAAFDVPVHLHARDRTWVMRDHHRLAFWDEEERTILPGLTLLRLGGHFPGGTVMHWQEGAGGEGALLVGDILQVGADRKTLSFQWSYPNRLPLSAATVARMAGRLADRRFKRIYGPFGLHVREAAAACLRHSARRHQELLAAEQP